MRVYAQLAGIGVLTVHVVRTRQARIKGAAAKRPPPGVAPPPGIHAAKAAAYPSMVDPGREGTRPDK